VSVPALQSVVEQLLAVRAACLTPEDRAIFETILSVWYAPPGVEAAQATPIDPDTELIRTPYSSGTYYVRALPAPPRAAATEDDVGRLVEGARFYRAIASQHIPSRPLEVQMIHARAIDTEVAYNAQLSRRNQELLAEVERQRKALHDAEDTVRSQQRDIDQLSAELEAAREDQNPLFGDETMKELLTQLNIWLRLPSGGTSQKYLEELFDGFAVFVQEIAADDVLLRRIVKRQPEAWNKISEVFNRIAENKRNESRIPAADKMMGLLDQNEAMKQGVLQQARKLVLREMRAHLAKTKPNKVTAATSRTRAPGRQRSAARRAQPATTAQISPPKRRR
jgi:hypothetical protein